MGGWSHQVAAEAGWTIPVYLPFAKLHLKWQQRTLPFKNFNSSRHLSIYVSRTGTYDHLVQRLQQFAMITVPHLYQHVLILHDLHQILHTLMRITQKHSLLRSVI